MLRTLAPEGDSDEGRFVKKCTIRRETAGKTLCRTSGFFGLLAQLRSSIAFAGMQRKCIEQEKRCLAFQHLPRTDPYTRVDSSFPKDPDLLVQPWASNCVHIFSCDASTSTAWPMSSGEVTAIAAVLTIASVDIEVCYGCSSSCVAVADFASKDDDDHERRPQRRRQEEPVVFKLRRHMLNLAENVRATCLLAQNRADLMA